MLALLMTLVPQVQDPAPGIALELARARSAHVAAVRYDLHFQLDAGAEHVTGEGKITFELTAAGAALPLVIDFDGELRGALGVNGRDVGEDDGVQARDGHLVLPPALLREGRNSLQLQFASRVAPTGTPLSVYRDPADGREYYYTLVVPADAHRLYPCFDQPDLKARYSVTLDVPADWVVVGNGREQGGASRDGRRLWSLQETRPLPTYLMAFAAGPFAVIEQPTIPVAGIDDGAPFRLFLRENQRELLDVAAVDRMHRDGLAWLRDYFGVDYPFGKLDAVLLPGFPYGGMEHAGAIFYREQAVLFDHTPTAGELVRRSTLVYHELSHQWFGNLVTMRWFDDLWLKEGFATFVGYQCMQVLEPERKAWLRFLQRVKPRAYEVDGTPGTTPVFQELQNLADAKSAYGAIVYNKAPAVLRELHEALGADAFRRGLTSFLVAHSYGNATWRDLAASLEAAADRDLTRWSERWLLAPSMPQVRVEWQADAAGKVTSAQLTQRPIGGEGTWPLRVELLVIDEAGRRKKLTLESDAPSAPVAALVGTDAPRCVLANPTDVAYGQFVPDPQSREHLLAHAIDEPDPLVRAVMTAALFESVREAELDPARFVELAIGLLDRETDADTHAWLLGALGTCLGRYLTPTRAAPLRARTCALLLAQLDAGSPGRELQTFRFLATHGRGDAVTALCERVVRGRDLPAGLAPGKQDRFLAGAALLAATGDDTELSWLEQHYAGEDVGKYAFLARAATPTAESKADYWRQYLQLDAPPEQWTQDSLAWFHWDDQDALTLPYLQQALEQAHWVKRNRRIFFMPAWLDEFVNGHSSGAALAIIDAFLATAELEPDVRRKLLQSRDGLQRAVRVRAAFE